MCERNTATVSYLLSHYQAIQVEDKRWLIENKDKGWSFYVIQDAVYEHARPGEKPSVWDWKIGTQYFDKDTHSANYLARLIDEKNTGIRYINRPKRKVPNICGSEDYLRKHENDSWGCKAQRGSFGGLCPDCPIGEEIQAKRDGVTLQYGEFDMFESGKTFSHVLKNDTFNVRCNRCGKVVLREPEIAEYPYYCPHCDENNYEFETYVGEWHTGKEFDELRCAARDTLGLDDEKEEPGNE